MSREIIYLEDGTVPELADRNHQSDIAAVFAEETTYFRYRDRVQQSQGLVRKHRHDFVSIVCA